MAVFLDHEIELLREAFPQEEATLEEDFTFEELDAISSLEILKFSAKNYLSKKTFDEIKNYL